MLKFIHSSIRIASQHSHSEIPHSYQVSVHTTNLIVNKILKKEKTTFCAKIRHGRDNVEEINAT